MLLHLVLGYAYLNAANAAGLLGASLGIGLVSVAVVAWLFAGGLIVARWIAYSEPFEQLLKTSLAWLVISVVWFALVPLLLLTSPRFRSWAGLTREPRTGRTPRRPRRQRPL